MSKRKVLGPSHWRQWAVYIVEGQAVFLIKFTVGLLDFVYKLYFYFWFIFQMPPLVG